METTLEKLEFEIDSLFEYNKIIIFKMKRKQYLRYMLYAINQVIKIYKKEYPKNKCLKNAIRAIKKVLKEDSENNRERAAKISAIVGNNADIVSRAHKISSINSAAGSVAWAVWAASRSVAYFDIDAIIWTISSVIRAYSNNISEYADNVYYKAQKYILKKILNYGIKLLKEEK